MEVRQSIYLYLSPFLKFVLLTSVTTDPPGQPERKTRSCYAGWSRYLFLTTLRLQEDIKNKSFFKQPVKEQTALPNPQQLELRDRATLENKPFQICHQPKLTAITPGITVTTQISGSFLAAKFFTSVTLWMWIELCILHVFSFFSF